MPTRAFRAAAWLWRLKMGGPIPWAIAARAWRSIEDEPEFMERLSRYLDAHQGEKAVYVSPWKFAQTFGQWSNAARVISHDEAVKAFRKAGVNPPAVMPREGYSPAQLAGAIRSAQR